MKKSAPRHAPDVTAFVDNVSLVEGSAMPPRNLLWLSFWCSLALLCLCSGLRSVNLRAS